MLTIKRKNDSRFVRCIEHKVADIRGGVGVSVANLGGVVLHEGTPLCVGSNGLYDVVKTAKVVTAYSSGTSLDIAKGSHFKANEYISVAGSQNLAKISSIDKSDASKDVLTLDAALGEPIAKNGVIVLVTKDTITHTAVAFGAHSTTTVTEIKVDKGSNIAVGDFVAGATDAADPMTGKAVVNIIRGEGYDTIVVGAQIGKAIADNEVLTTVKAANDSSATETNIQSYDIPISQGDAVLVTGDTYDVVPGENLYVNAWCIGVLTEDKALVAFNSAIKTALKGFVFV
jgi:hypothetical protein